MKLLLGEPNFKDRKSKLRDLLTMILLFATIWCCILKHHTPQVFVHALTNFNKTYLSKSEVLAHRSFLLNGVTEIPYMYATYFFHHGPNTFPIIISSEDKQAVAVAASFYGKGRVCAFGNDAYLDYRDSSNAKKSGIDNLIKNCVKWTTNSKPNVTYMLHDIGDNPLFSTISGLTRYTTSSNAFDTVNKPLETVDLLILNLLHVKQVTPEMTDMIRSFLARGGGIITGLLGYSHDYQNQPELFAGNIFFADFGISYYNTWYGHGQLLAATDEEVVSSTNNPFWALDKILIDKATTIDSTILDNIKSQLNFILESLQKPITVDSTISFSYIRDIYQYYCSSMELVVPFKTDSQKLCVRLVTLMNFINSLPLESNPEILTAQAVVPGLPTNGANFTNSQIVTVQSSVSTIRTGWQCSGYFAVPGATLTITFNSTVGLSRVVVGGQGDDLSRKDVWVRWPKMTTSRSINGDTLSTGTFVAYSGGVIYFEVSSSSPIPLDFNATITGQVVKVPFWKKGVHTNQDWLTIRNYPSPYIEIEGTHFILAIKNTPQSRALDDVEQLADYWGESIMNLVYELSQRPVRKYKERFQTDIDISIGYMHSGYPIMAYPDQDLRTLFVNNPVTIPLKPNTPYRWGHYHELGHNFQIDHWTYSGSFEVTVNLFTLYLLEHYPAGSKVYDDYDYNPPNREGWETELMKDPFSDWPKAGMLFQLDLIKGFGWIAMKKFFASYVQDQFYFEKLGYTIKVPTNDDEKRDQWLLRYSSIVGRNLAPFFALYHFPVSKGAIANVTQFPYWMPNDFVNDCSNVPYPESPCVSLTISDPRNGTAETNYTIDITTWSPIKPYYGEHLVISFWGNTAPRFQNNQNITLTNIVGNLKTEVSVYVTTEKTVLSIFPSAFIPSGEKLSFSFVTTNSYRTGQLKTTVKHINEKKELINVVERPLEINTFITLSDKIGPMLCDLGFYGEDCSITTCFGVIGNESTACSGHGVCAKMDLCICSGKFFGPECADVEFWSRDDVATHRDYMLQGVTSIKSLYNSFFTISGPNVFSLFTTTSNNQIIVAGTYHGKGRIVAFGTPGYLNPNDHNDAGVTTLLTNVVKWTTKKNSKVTYLLHDVTSGFYSSIDGLQVFEGTANAFDEILKPLESIDLLVISLQHLETVTDSMKSSLIAYMERGGAIITGANGWEYPFSLTYDPLKFPGNILFAEMGILWRLEYPFGTLGKSTSYSLDSLNIYWKIDTVVSTNSYSQMAEVEMGAIVDIFKIVPLSSVLSHPLFSNISAISAVYGNKCTLFGNNFVSNTQKCCVLLADILIRLGLLPLANNPQIKNAEIFHSVPIGMTYQNLTESSSSVSIKPSKIRLQCSGYFAVPGANVTVTVSDSSSIISVIVGGQMDNVINDSTWYRWPTFSITKTLSSNTTGTFIAYSGGVIYFDVSSTKSFTATISGNVLKMPFWKKGVHTNQDWISMRNDPAPYMEIEGTNLVLSVRSTSKARLIEDIDSYATFWGDNVMNILYDFTQKPILEYKERLHLDRQCTSTGTLQQGPIQSGYPIYIYDGETDKIMYPTHYIEEGTPSNTTIRWTYYDAIGKNFENNNMTYYRSTYTQSVLVLLLEENYPSGSRRYGEKSYNPPNREGWEDTYLKKTGDYHENWESMNTIFHLELIKTFGWTTMKKFWRSYLDESLFNHPSGDNLDQWLVRYSTLTNRDLTSFFTKYIMPVSDAAKTKAAKFKAFGTSTIVDCKQVSIEDMPCFSMKSLNRVASAMTTYVIELTTWSPVRGDLGDYFVISFNGATMPVFNSDTPTIKVLSGDIQTTAFVGIGSTNTTLKIKPNSVYLKPSKKIKFTISARNSDSIGALSIGVKHVAVDGTLVNMAERGPEVVPSVVVAQTCFGVSNTDAVCSGNGYCTGNNMCTCDYGWTGSSCSIASCNGKPATQLDACSVGFTCTDINVCTNSSLIPSVSTSENLAQTNISNSDSSSSNITNANNNSESKNVSDSSNSDTSNNGTTAPESTNTTNSKNETNAVGSNTTDSTNTNTTASESTNTTNLNNGTSANDNRTASESTNTTNTSNTTNSNNGTSANDNTTSSDGPYSNSTSNNSTTPNNETSTVNGTDSTISPSSNATKDNSSTVDTSNGEHNNTYNTNDANTQNTTSNNSTNNYEGENTNSTNETNNSSTYNQTNSSNSTNTETTETNNGTTTHNETTATNTTVTNSTNVINNNITNASISTNNGTNTSPSFVNEFSSAEKITLLKKHNIVRLGVLNPPAASIGELVWDEELERVATAYASKCVFSHNDARSSEYGTGYVGENLYSSSVSIGADSKSVDSWASEAQYFTYPGTCQSGKACGHYTQLVWENTKNVGCARKTCPTIGGLSSAFNGGSIVVCNYYPGGNWAGEKPYVALVVNNTTTNNTDTIKCQYDCGSNGVCNSDGTCSCINGFLTVDVKKPCSSCPVGKIESATGTSCICNTEYGFNSGSGDCTCNQALGFLEAYGSCVCNEKKGFFNKQGSQCLCRTAAGYTNQNGECIRSVPVCSGCGNGQCYFVDSISNSTLCKCNSGYANNGDSQCSTCATGFTQTEGKCKRVCPPEYSGDDCSIYTVTPSCVSIPSTALTFCKAYLNIDSYRIKNSLLTSGAMNSTHAKDLIILGMKRLDSQASTSFTQTLKSFEAKGLTCDSKCHASLSKLICFETISTCGLVNNQPEEKRLCKTVCEVIISKEIQNNTAGFSDSCSSLPDSGCYYGSYLPPNTHCYGKLYSNSLVCSSGRGECTDVDTCTCKSGYAGNECQHSVCFAKDSNNTGVCSGHGDCASPNTCKCQDGFTGLECLTPTCNGKSEVEGGCSFRGQCSNSHTCACTGNYAGASCSSCKTGFSGTNCDVPICNGMLSSDKKVCSGRGLCESVNGIPTCVCNSGFDGSSCQNFKCNGTDRTSASVCSQHGKCTSADVCTCEGNYDAKYYCSKCIPSFNGDGCANRICSEKETCNSRGTCNAEFKCECSGNWVGDFCNLCIDGWVGSDCSISCSPTKNCNGKGSCNDDGSCKCNGNFVGASCNSCKPGWYGDKCDYSIDETSFEFNENGDMIYGTIYTSMKKKIACSDLIQNVASIGSGAICSLNGDKNRVQISLGQNPSIQIGGTLQFKKYPNSTITTDTINSVVHNTYYVSIAPNAAISARPTSVSKACGRIYLDASNSVSLDRRSLLFSWSTLNGPSNSDVEMLDSLISSQTSSGVSFEATQLGVGTYTVQVVVSSSFSGEKTSASIGFTVSAETAPTLTIKEGLESSLTIGSSFVITPIISFPSCYSGSGPIAYTYSVVKSPVSITLKQNNDLLVFSDDFTKIIEEGDYYFNVKAQQTGAASVNLSFKVTAKALPLKVGFSIRDMQQSFEDNVKFSIIKHDPSNPSDTSGQVKILCLNTDTAQTCSGFDDNSNNIEQASLTFNKLMEVGSYMFTVSFTKSSRTTSSSVKVTVLDQSKSAIIRISISPPENTELTALDPSEDLILQASSLDYLSTKRIFKWSSPDMEFDSSVVVNKKYLVIPKTMFAPGASYNVKVAVLDGSKQGDAEISFTINSPPTVGVLEIQPSSGVALKDEFQIKCGNGWSDSQLPLSFKFLYKLPTDNTWNLLSEKSEKRSIATSLPAGQLEIKAIVYDAKGANSETTGTVIVNLPVDASSALDVLNSQQQGSVTVSSLTSVLSVVQSVSAQTEEQREALKSAGKSFVDKYFEQQDAQESVMKESSSGTASKLSAISSISNAASNLPDDTVSKIIGKFSTTISSASDSSNIQMTPDDIENTRNTADKLKEHVEKNLEKRSIQVFSQSDLRNLESVYNKLVNVELKSAVADMPASRVKGINSFSYARLLSIPTIGGLIESLKSDVYTPFNISQKIGALPEFTNVENVKLIMRSYTNTNTSLRAVSSIYDFTILSTNNELFQLSSSSELAQLTLDTSTTRSFLSDNKQIVCKQWNGVEFDSASGCSIVYNSSLGVVISVSSTGSFVLISQDITSPAIDPITSTNPQQSTHEQPQASTSTTRLPTSSASANYIAFILFTIPLIALVAVFTGLIYWYCKSRQLTKMAKGKNLDIEMASV